MHHRNICKSLLLHSFTNTRAHKHFPKAVTPSMLHESIIFACQMKMQLFFGILWVHYEGHNGSVGENTRAPSTVANARLNSRA